MSQYSSLIDNDTDHIMSDPRQQIFTEVRWEDFQDKYSSRPKRKNNTDIPILRPAKRARFIIKKTRKLIDTVLSSFGDDDWATLFGSESPRMMLHAFISTVLTRRLQYRILKHRRFNYWEGMEFNGAVFPRRYAKLIQPRTHISFCTAIRLHYQWWRRDENHKLFRYLFL